MVREAFALSSCRDKRILKLCSISEVVQNTNSHLDFMQREIMIIPDEYLDECPAITNRAMSP